MEMLVRCLRRGLQPLLRLIYKYYLRMEIHRVEALPPDQVYLYCSNHSSHLDSLAIVYGSGLREKQFVATAAHDYFFRSPMKMNLFKLFINIIPLKRNPSFKQVKENLRCIQEQLHQGKNIIFYPEGTRSVDGSMQPFKKGLGFVAQSLRVPVVPVYIQGAHRSWPKGKWFPRPGQLKVFFGRPIDIHLKIDQSSEQITSAVYDEVMKLAKQGQVPVRVLDFPGHYAAAPGSGFENSAAETELKESERQAVNS